MKSKIIRWFCSNGGSTSMFVKIVHPGGHVELHDRPIPVTELLNRNPKCCVAYPTVFRRPQDIVTPGAMLALGHKYYIVPVGTIRRLQFKYPQPSKIGPRRRGDTYGSQGLSSLSSCWSSCKVSKGNDMERSEHQRQNGNYSSGEESEVTESQVKKDSYENHQELGTPGRINLESRDDWHFGLKSIVEE